MTYSDRAMREIATDPVRLKGYFWRVATNARLMATINRHRVQKGFALESGSLKPETLENMANDIIENIDALVSATLQRR